VTVVAVAGDATTTTAVALAVGWPTHEEVIVLEADPRGGSLAGWLDAPAQPSLATIVANLATESRRDHRSTVATFDAMTQHSRSGIRFVANAVRTRAARRAADEAATTVLPAIADANTTVIADVGDHRADLGPATTLGVADVVVLVHYQAKASAAAATVRIERLVETVEELAHLDADLVLAVIGNTPFTSTEIGMFVGDSVPDVIQITAAVADDPLAAATIAGRSGVSAKRLRRLPLMRDTSALAVVLSELVDLRRRSSARLGSGEQTT